MFRSLWRRHRRVLIAFALGLLAALVVPLALGDRALIGADLFFLVYLLLTVAATRRLTPADLRRHHGEETDEGAWLIVLLALTAVGVSLIAVVGSLMGSASGWHWQPVLAVASVPLGWATLHTVMAFHYAGLYYAKGNGSGGGDARGLIFPDGKTDPGVWDFLYFSLTLGMCAQTSDIAIGTTRLRRVVALHSVLSYFYNTVILALAVNAAVDLGGKSASP